MGRIGMGEIVVIAIVIVFLFGAKKLPELGSAIGKFLKEFKKASREVDESIKEVNQDSEDAKKP